MEHRTNTLGDRKGPDNCEPDQFMPVERLRVNCSRIESIATAVYIAANWKGLRNFSGGIQRKGKEMNQNTTKPMNSYVVVGMLSGSVFLILENWGQMAVMQTLSPCKYACVKSDVLMLTIQIFRHSSLDYNSVKALISNHRSRTLNGVPDEVEEHSL